MKRHGNSRMVFVTCATPMQAKLIARSCIEKRLAACVNILKSPIDSYYRWQGKIEKSREILLLIKTTAKKLDALEAEVKRLHSYDVPEFIAAPIVAGSEKYLSWLADSVQ